MAQDTKVSKKGSNHPIPAVFEHLGLHGVKPSDRLSLVIQNGIIEATRQDKSGVTQTVMKHLSSDGFVSATHYDPNKISKEQRDELIRAKYAKGERQSRLASAFNLSQSMISKIIATD